MYAEIFKHEAIAILARTLHGEGRNQPRHGKVAIASVVLNRVAADSWWGDDVVEVCLWPSQFSAWGDRDPNLKVMLEADDTIMRLGHPTLDVSNAAFNECMEIAIQAMDGRLEDNTEGSTHYINPKVLKRRPAWAEGKTPVVVIADHEFYNNVR